MNKAKEYIERFRTNDRELIQAEIDRVANAVPCEVCGRPLTDPESVAMGIGPECASKVGESEIPLRAGQVDTILKLSTGEMVIVDMKTGVGNSENNRLVDLRNALNPDATFDDAGDETYEGEEE